MPRPASTRAVMGNRPSSVSRLAATAASYSRRIHEGGGRTLPLEPGQSPHPTELPIPHLDQCVGGNAEQLVELALERRTEGRSDSLGIVVRPALRLGDDLIDQTELDEIRRGQPEGIRRLLGVIRITPQDRRTGLRRNDRIGSVLQNVDAVTDADAVPVGATAVTYNLTVAGATGPNFVAITPGDATGFTTSAINTTGTGSIANAGTVAVDGSRRVKLWGGDNTGSVHTIVDITGYYAPQVV